MQAPDRPQSRNSAPGLPRRDAKVAAIALLSYGGEEMTMYGYDKLRSWLPRGCCSLLAVLVLLSVLLLGACDAPSGRADGELHPRAPAA